MAFREDGRSDQAGKDSDFALFASPTYKATYTGLLKAFLDRYPANGLQGIAAACLVTGAGAGHSMAPTTSLLPLLVELGASVPVRGVYFSTTQMDQIDDLIASLGAEVINALKPPCGPGRRAAGAHDRRERDEMMTVHPIDPRKFRDALGHYSVSYYLITAILPSVARFGSFPP